MARPDLLPSLIFTMVKLCIDGGNSILSCYAYGGYGFFLCTVMEEIALGYELNKLALRMLDRYESREITCKLKHLFNCNILHWKKPARNAIALMSETTQIGLETGDVQYAAYSAIEYCVTLFAVGEPLEFVYQEVEKYSNLVQKLKQEEQYYYSKITGQLVLNLIGEVAERGKLIGEQFDEVAMLPMLQEKKNTISLFLFYLAKTILNFLFQDYTEAVKNVILAEQYEQSALGLIISAEHNFYYSLSLLALCNSDDSNQKSEYLQQVTTNQQKMKLWADHAPMNLQHKYDLVEAEKAKVLGQYWEASELYEQAIKGARDNQYFHEEAIAYELAAEFYLAVGRAKIAETYIRESHYGYIRWQAKAKVKDLEQHYSQFFTQSSTSQAQKISSSLSSISSSSSTSSTVLDLASVLKASQAISGEIILANLLAKLMKIVIENAGATRGVLILPAPSKVEMGQIIAESANQWLIEALGTVESDTVEVLGSIPLESVNGNSDNPLVCQAIVNYVIRTQKNLVLGNATIDKKFNRNSYIVKQQPKSILCTPLVDRAKLVGIVYLENNLATNAFTTDRIELLNLLSSQIAISIENAKLYSELQSITYGLVTFQDISQRKKTEKLLTDYNRTLEQEVSDRTQQLSQALADLQAAQDELIQSEKMAALGQLIAGVAHEINTPLGAIRASIDNISTALAKTLQQLPQLLQQLSPQQQTDFFVLLAASRNSQNSISFREERKLKCSLRQELTAKGIENPDAIATILVKMGITQNLEPFLSLLNSPSNTSILDCAYNLSMQQSNSANIKLAVERAAKIVFALKSYARQDNSGHMTQAHITDGIDVVLTLYHNQLKQGIEVIKNYEPVPEILCYPEELNQVWTNLIHNAIQAMGDRGKLNIAVTEQNNGVLVQITDSGAGIPVEIKDKIFTPFFTTKPAGEGTGLGLDIVSKIIDKHQGTIEVTSEPGNTVS